MEDDGTLLMKLINWIGLCKDKSFDSAMPCGGHWKDQPPCKDLVLDHIILDLTGGSVSLESISDVGVQRAFRRKKRLLRRSNTVLFSRLAIMALVAIMLVFTTLLTWYFTSTYSARSIRSLASLLREQFLRTSLQAMASILGEVYNATLVLSSLHQQVYYASLNTSWESVELELRRVNRGVFRAQRQYSSVAFVSEDGRLTDYTRGRDSEYLFFVNATYGQTQAWYIQNLTGFIDETDAPLPSRRNPPYPLSAENVLDSKPLEVYWTIAPNLMGEPVVSPAVPARDLVTDNFLGLATITTTFKHLNSYLATMDLLDGFLYFQWDNGIDRSLIVASSYNGTSDVLVSPQNASNLIVRAAANFLASTFRDGVMAKDPTHSHNVQLMGRKYYIDTMPLALKPYNVLNLTAVMIVPRKSIMGRIDQRNRTVVGVSVGTAIGVLIIGCCFICLLTSKMSTEMQLRQELIRQLVAKHRAEQSSNYKSQFLANMSHELRTPMAGIIGLLDLLACDTLTPDQEVSVAQIQRCATGLLDLVNNVLDISKVEAGKMELEVAPFSISDELESLVDMFAVQCVGSSIDIVLDLSDNIPPVVKGDPTRIRQIFSNLLSNSVKFTTQGNVLVRGWVDQSLLEPDRKHSDVSVGMLNRRDKSSGPLFMGAENKVALVFEVDDSGCGIPIDMRETVFDSFVQEDASTTRTHGGSGLGLYIVRSLVELMGGEVVVAPKLGPGTLMRFHIIVGGTFGGKKDQNLGRMAFEDHETLGSPSAEGLNSLLGSPLHLFGGDTLPLPEVLKGVQVLVAMQETVAQKVAVQWLEKRGLTVACVNVWADMIPTLEKMCKSRATEVKSVIKDVSRSIDSSKCHRDFLPSPNDRGSSEPATLVSENMLGSVNFPSVLALVDITMHPSMKVGFDSKFVEPSALSSRDSKLYRADLEKLPPHMQDILDQMVRIHSQYSLAVAWVVSPDCGARWKHALQADSSFLVMNKPLHGSRMRRLLALLSRTGKLDQQHWDVRSYQSSFRSTTRLVKVGTSSKEEEEEEPSLGKVLLVDIPCGSDENLELLSTSTPQSLTSGLITPGVPCGLTSPEEVVSQLITPEDADSTRDVVQEVWMNGLEARDVNEEWQGSKIGLSVPITVQRKQDIELNMPIKAEQKQDIELSMPIKTESKQSMDSGFPGPLDGQRKATESSHEGIVIRADSRTTTAACSAAALGPNCLSSMHILLVEDTPVLQRLAGMMLKKLGANVTVVGDGLQAVKAVAEAVEASCGVCADGGDAHLSHILHFDLILMDCAMPVMDGYNATIAIRAAEENTSRHIPIVALTAHALASDEERCLSVGMDAYLTKPINCRLMVSTIQNLVSRGRE